MSTPQIETKLELAVESIEGLLIAIVSAKDTSGDRALAAFDAVQAARQDCKDALRGILTPTFRVVQ